MQNTHGKVEQLPNLSCGKQNSFSRPEEPPSNSQSAKNTGGRNKSLEEVDLDLHSWWVVFFIESGMRDPTQGEKGARGNAPGVKTKSAGGSAARPIDRASGKTSSSNVMWVVGRCIIVRDRRAPSSVWRFSRTAQPLRKGGPRIILASEFAWRGQWSVPSIPISERSDSLNERKGADGLTQCGELKEG